LGAKPPCLSKARTKFALYWKKYKCFYFYNFNKSNNFNILITKYQCMYIKLTKHIHLNFFSKVQILFWPWEGIGVLRPTYVNFCSFWAFSVIYCNFCSFWVSFIYRCWFVVVSSLVDYLILFLLIFCLMEFFTFLWKTYFVEKLFLINSKKWSNGIILHYMHWTKHWKESIKPYRRTVQNIQMYQRKVQ
jgi:hypothetical protein